MDVHLRLVRGIRSCHSIRIPSPGERATRLAPCHGLALAPTWCGTGPRRTPERRTDCTRNIGYRSCCRIGRLFDRQTRHRLDKGWIDHMSTNTTQLLAEIPLFATMDDEERKQFHAIMKERSFQTGQVVMAASDPEASFFIIEQGEMEVWLTDTDGKKVVLEVLGPGKVFGNLFMHSEKTRSANATTSGELVTLALSREAFFDFLRRRPDTTIDLLVELGQRLKHTDDILRTRVSRNANEEHDETISPGQRVADIIADFSGSLAFLLLNLAVFVIWIVANTVGPAIWHYDTYPFQFLTMAVSLEAIFLSI